MLRRFLALDARRRRLVASALGWVVGARLVLRIGGRSLSERQRLLDRVSAFWPAAAGCSLDEATWAITAVARRIPGTRCLAWAVALSGLLTRVGVEAELRIGVAAAGPGAIKAHAWVECGGRALSWGDDVDGYSVLRPRAVAR
jgi:hypothetical protein